MSSMFCYQCQEAAKGTGCTVQGVCGKPADVANLQDLLIYLLKGISFWGTRGRIHGRKRPRKQICSSPRHSLPPSPMPIFDIDRFVPMIHKAIELREALRERAQAACFKQHGNPCSGGGPDWASWKRGRRQPGRIDRQRDERRHHGRNDR